MGIIDIIILICFLPCIWVGLKNGLVKQIVSVCIIYFGITLSLRFSGIVSEWLGSFFDGATFLVKILSFVIVFFVIAVLLTLLGKLIEKIITLSLLGWLNRLLGLVLAFFFFLMAISALLYLVNAANNLLHFIPAEEIASSHLYNPLLTLAATLFPLLKSLF